MVAEVITAVEVVAVTITTVAADVAAVAGVVAVGAEVGVVLTSTLRTPACTVPIR